MSKKKGGKKSKRSRFFFRRPHFLRLVGICAAHALVLTVLTFVWMNQNWQLGDEVLVARINQIVNILVLNKRDREVNELRDHFLFVNCSYDKTITAFEDVHGTGTLPITDRRKLATFLDVLREGNPACVVLDLTFDVPSKDDTALFRSILAMPRVLAATYKNDEELVTMPASIPTALAEYSTTSGIFLKSQVLYNDSTYFLPAALYQTTNAVPLHEHWGFITHGHNLWMNSFIVDLRLRKVHLEDNTLLCWNLGDALEYFSKEDILAIVNNRIIIIGDFYLNDQHDTLLGKQPGPMLVANAYAALEMGDAAISWFAVSGIFLLYALSTGYVLSVKGSKRKLFGRKQGRLGGFAVKYLGYVVVFTLFSMGLYLITGKHHQLLLFALYFNLVEFWAVKYKWRKRVR